ncbi:MAG TPA: hypothetical protein VFP49_14165, partial [Nitrososphaeraceae archaeon]|nr:hypothetical protein [Nitrososphaeraceae archaeon]
TIAIAIIIIIIIIIGRWVPYSGYNILTPIRPMQQKERLCLNIVVKHIPRFVCIYVVAINSKSR